MTALLNASGRLGKLVRLLASDKPGEVTAAVAAINRALRSAGLDIHALAEIVDRSPIVPRQSPDSPTATSDDNERPWRNIRSWCADHDEFLTDRECEFISSLAHWRGRPTEKQMNWLLLIEQKIRARQSR